LGVGCVSEIGGIILAGGKGQRLGQEKACVDIGGRSLLERAIAKLECFVNEIVIVKSLGSHTPFASEGSTKVVNDHVSGKGPLAGIHAGLVHSSFLTNVVLACDMPLVSSELLSYMVKMSAGYDIVVPRINRCYEPLAAVYSKECICVIEDMLSQDVLKVEALFPRMRTRFVDKKEIIRFDPENCGFMNINRPADIEKARRILGGTRIGI